MFPPAPGPGPLTRAAANTDDWISWRDAIRIDFVYPNPEHPPLPGDPARIDFASLEQAFSITPAVRGNLIRLQRPDNTDDFLFVPAAGERFLNNTRYRIVISRGLTNMEGTAMREDFIVSFTADIEDITIERLMIQNADSLAMPYLEIGRTGFNTFAAYPITVFIGEDPDYFSIGFSDNFVLAEADRYQAADQVSLVKIFPGSGYEYAKRNVTFGGGDLTIAYQDVPDELDSIFKLTIKGGPEGLIDSSGAYLPGDVFLYFKINVREVR
jgi:hypothetical protein